MKINYPIIIKDVLPTSTFFSLQDQFRYSGWGLYNYSNNFDKENERISWKLNEPNDMMIMFQCASIIKLKLQKYLKQDLIFIRAYSNGSTFGQTCRFHIDFEEDDVWTFVLFTEKNWNTQWGGEFVCYDGKEYSYVPHIPNAGVLIPANWEHYGSCPNELANCSRTSIGFSFAETDRLNQVLHHKVVRSFI